MIFDLGLREMKRLLEKRDQLDKIVQEANEVIIIYSINQFHFLDAYKGKCKLTKFPLKFIFLSSKRSNWLFNIIEVITLNIFKQYNFNTIL